MNTILIVDDDRDFRAGLAETLGDLGYAVLEAAGAAAVPALIASGVDAMILDLRMPGTDGMSLLAELRRSAQGAALPVIVLTAFADADNTIRAMSLGAVDHLTKPVGRADLKRALDAALSSVHAPAGASAPVANPDDSFIGQSPAMREVQKRIGLAAASPATVLIQGETGTGKERVARLLHAHSARAKSAFVAINCAAIPAELLEAELFGHRRGAFTGAQIERTGLIRAAHGGTLFLDEIGDMPLAMQAKLLRVLEERTVTPLGENTAQPVDLRVLAATHQNLHARVQDGAFRQDLYFRLNVLVIELPPLRARPEDIAALAEHFLRLSRPDAPRRLGAAAIERLRAHAWPGNVRELRNVMERLSVVVRGAQIEAEDLVFLGDSPGRDGDLSALLDGELPAAIEAIERRMIERALAACAGNRSAAAKRLGIHRQQLYAKLERYGL